MLSKKIGKKMFPYGCPYCGKDVLFMSSSVIDGEERGKKIYLCEDFLERNEVGYPVCNTYVYAHKEGLHKDEPKGVLADLKLRNLHSRVYELYAPLYRDMVINDIERYVVSFMEEDLKYGRVLSVDKDMYYIEMIFEDRFVEKNKTECETISPKVKSQIWLAEKLGISFELANILLFDEDRSKNAINILKKCKVN